MYTVLARKYRSQSFDDVVGQNPISQTLKNAIKTGKVAHAYLFTGTRGVGKTTMARILAKALNCLSAEAPTIEPCCKCESCIAINLGEDIDVIEIDGASNNGVEEVRRLRENAIYRPARGRFKIYIIDEVHMLSTSAFNALLKILEEPPSHVKFIFATTEPNKVIPTIQSRCQRFDFTNINPNLIAGQLKSILEQEKIKYEESLILPIAKMANGSMRDGLSLLDRLISTGVEPLNADLLEEYLGCPNSEKIYNLIAKIGDSDAAGTLAATEDLINAGLSEVQLADSLVDYMRDLMVAKSAGAESELLVLTAEQRQQAGRLAEKFDIAALVYNITTLERLRRTLKGSDTPRALLDASLLRFALSEHFLNIDELLLQLKGSPTRQGTGPAAGPIKKKQIANPSTTNTIAEKQTEPVTEKKIDSPAPSDIQSIKSDWQNILKIISTKLGNSTAGLLTSAEPSRFEGGLLTITFPGSAEMQKKMCESNGRVTQIQSLLSEHCGGNVRLKFETASKETTPAANQPKTTGQKRAELINDPAVRTILMGLDATITGIEDGQRDG
ncbi:MAG: DNA polymerase III subunit gamma/tau [Phycisphaerae bacterium]|nr:DNA polymerase III subunit gamma/tau [Phycisphaerae bacterium]MDD5380704.1 DNA polymerase III subunit gamma/tau [Phycisphaerae bacterium]